MSYSVRILADSASPHGPRITTIEATYPRSLHSELMAYRAFSRTTAPSNAVTLQKTIEEVRHDPVYPVSWSKNQRLPAKQHEELSPKGQILAKVEWRKAMEFAIERAERLSKDDIDLHKQIVEGLLAPFSRITVLITATEWANFFTQRCRPDAGPEIQRLAELIRHEYAASKPETLKMRDWHLPFIEDDERSLPIEQLRSISVARCARVSVLAPGGKRDAKADLALYDKLIDEAAAGNWSPFEHVATPADDLKFYGNVRGWRQFRKNFPHENVVEYSAELPDGNIFTIGKARPLKREVSVFDKGPRG
jgi:hypothetical protein